MKYARFIYESLKHPREVGTFTQSTKFLAKEMAKEINSKHVIELGAGTGSVTARILEYLPTDGRLTCLEINPKFCDYLKKMNDARLRVVNDDAENVEAHLDGSDCVVSSLPLALMGKAKRQEVLRISSKAKTYIQLQYAPFLRKQLGNYFSDVQAKFVWRNFPFAFIYICFNNRSKQLKT